MPLSGSRLNLHRVYLTAGTFNHSVGNYDCKPLKNRRVKAVYECRARSVKVWKNIIQGRFIYLDPALVIGFTDSRYWYTKLAPPRLHTR